MSTENNETSLSDIAAIYYQWKLKNSNSIQRQTHRAEEAIEHDRDGDTNYNGST